MGIDTLNTKFKSKWSAQIGKRGFAAVPHCIITCPDELGLNQVDKSILEVIIGKCWEAGDVAWPSVEYIARCIGRKSSTVTASTTKLEKNGWINKKQRFNDTNLYSLEPAISKLDKHLKICPIFNKKAESYQNIGGLDSQKTGDYIEPILTRTNNISRSFKNSDSLNSSYKKYKYSICEAIGGRHEWRESIKYWDEDIYCFTCINCGKTFRKKGEQPWLAEYPVLGVGS